MAERKPLSKKVRFEIFKRDEFTCQYCGRTPPDVILEVDHINPVVNGGGNDQMNLITSCFDCNRGKGKHELGNVIPRPDADLKWLETQQEICELKRYKEAKDERDNLYYEIAASLCETWMSAFQSSVYPKESEFIKLIKKISPDIIERAIYITASRNNLSSDFMDRWKYVCGVAWNIIKRDDE